MKEQIDEMAKDLQKSEHWYFDEKSVDFELDRRKTAENLYNAGWRKQKEGEWRKHEESIWEHRYWCSVCNFYRIGAPTPHCQNCGAKMKGADNEN